MRVVSTRGLKSPIGQTVIGVIMIAFGLFVALVLAGKQEKLQKRCTGETTGKIVSVSVHYDSDNNAEYSYRIEYEVNGKKITDESETSRSVSEGETYTVMYDPDKPDDHYVKEFSGSPKTIRYVGFGASGIGLIFAAVGIIRLMRGR